MRRLEKLLDASHAPLFYLTICVEHRRAVLANERVFNVLVRAWEDALSVHGWSLGRYVVMPDHVHFFATPSGGQAKDLSSFIECWKRWTQRQIRQTGLPSFNWQTEFFDHLMRSGESYAEKWEYVRGNPVRARLVAEADAWPYQGEIHSLRW